MARNSALNDHFLIVALAIGLGANFIAGHYFSYPFLYCWGWPVAVTLYMACGTVILYIVSAFTLYALLRGAMVHAIGGTLIFIGITELPRLAHMLFMTGGSCG